MTTPQTADQRDDEQAREWNTYEARVPIDFYGTRAYNKGDRVPVSVVEGDQAWVDSSWVTRLDENSEPNAGSATVPPPGPPAIDQTVTAAPAASTPAPPPPPDDTSPPPPEDGGAAPTGQEG